MQKPTCPSRIAIVGGGKMGQAILSGWLAGTDDVCASLDASSFVVVNPGQEKRAYIEQTYGVSCVATVASLPSCDTVVLCVKPQIMAPVLEELSALPWVADALVISIAAGIPTDSLSKALGGHTRIVRAMPNTALAVGCGTTTVCGACGVASQDIKLVCDLFGAIGYACEVPEDLFDVTMAIGGCGPAYVAALVEALAQAGSQAGLDASVAETLAANMVLGTGKLMRQGNQSAQKTREDVCSPGGTTLAALDAMEKAGYSASIESGVAAAIQRSKELGA